MGSKVPPRMPIFMRPRRGFGVGHLQTAVDDNLGEQHGVGDDDELAVVGPQNRGADLDVLNRSGDVLDLDDIADDERPLPQQVQARYQVLEHVLDGEGDGQAGAPRRSAAR